MFEFVEDAVLACRAAVVEHHRAVERDDHRVTDLAALRIRSIMVYLRERDRTELIHPLTMEWATEVTPLNTNASVQSSTSCSVPSPTGPPSVRRHHSPIPDPLPRGKDSSPLRIRDLTQGSCMSATG